MRIPPAAAKALSRHVSRAVVRLDPDRYKQEPAYVAALFARLDGVVYKGRDFTLELKSTIVCDRGPNSAESTWGADFGIVASMKDRYGDLKKGVLGQAKHGSLVEQTVRQTESFRLQVAKMNAATKAVLGLEVPTVAEAVPTIRILEIPVMHGDIPLQSSPRHYEQLLKSRNPNEPAVLVGPAIPLSKYLVAELLRCLHGDLSEHFLRGLADSSLTCLRVEAQTVSGG